MELQTAIEILEYHQEWRLGKREDMIHEPKKLTEALDIVISEVKKNRLGGVGGSKIKCTCCPECGCKEYVNKNLVGDGFRMCRECHQEWWIDIKYDSPYCH